MAAILPAITVGVDIGGTFTDFVFLAMDGTATVRKHPTTPRNPALGVLSGLMAARSEGLIDNGYSLAHGTTVATNALLERRGVETALITTRGFGDILEIGRQSRTDIYALDPSRTAPLLDKAHRFEVSERVDFQGTTVAQLDEAELTGILEDLCRRKIKSVAICFLFAYLYPKHERRAAEIARAFGLEVSLSSEVSPEPREYERASTVTANAYVAPILQQYLAGLGEAIGPVGASSLRVMQSNGGALSPGDAAAFAIKTALSGPAAGVIAAARIGSELGLKRLLTFDMGGTSTDVALVIDGECPVVTNSILGGIPLTTPMLDIHTVGAGGGSQAWLDSAGALRVGPQSAGADPGPAAYGVGKVLTVTDANIYLGRMPADVRLAGSVSLDLAHVSACFEAFAAKIGRTPELLAHGIIAIAEASMVRALRHISIERGYAPADFVLLSFGGAGGLHACALAAELGIKEILVPRFPGALSALGLAVAPIRHELVRAFPAFPLTDCTSRELWSGVKEPLADLQAAGDRMAPPADRFGAAFQSELFLDVRYVGQSFEIRVPFTPKEPISVIADFHAMHHARFGHSDRNEPIEAVLMRNVMTGIMDVQPLRFPAAMKRAGSNAISLLHDGAGQVIANRYERGDLHPGQKCVGPSIVMQPDSATYIPLGWSGIVDPYSNLRLAQI